MSEWDGFNNDITANRYQQMFIQGYLDVSGRVIIRNGDLSLNNGNLFAGYDASINGNLTIGKDITINGNLSVKQYQAQSIINATTTNYQLIISEDISLNGRLLVSKDASLNGNIFINGDTNISGYLRPTTFIGFHLYRTSGFVNVTGNTIISNTQFNSNYFAHSSMNTTSCIFTAPFNGYYQFSYTTTIVPANVTQAVNLMLSTSASPTTTTAATDTIVGTIFYLPRTGSTEPINIPGAFSGIVKMAKNYTVYLYSPAARGGSAISGGADGANFFSGFLINAY